MTGELFVSARDCVDRGVLIRCDAGCDHGFVYMPRRECERCEGTGWLIPPGEGQVLAEALRDCMAELAASQDDAQAARRILDDHRAAVAAYETALAEPTP